MYSLAPETYSDMTWFEHSMFLENTTWKSYIKQSLVCRKVCQLSRIRKVFKLCYQPFLAFCHLPLIDVLRWVGHKICHKHFAHFSNLPLISRPWSRLALIFTKQIPAKGQIISECPYEIIVYPKIATKKFPRFLS